MTTAERGQETFRTLIEGANPIVLVTHVNPDGDALGSELALARFLQSRGKRVRILNHDPAPDTFDFLSREGIALELYAADRHDVLLDEAELVVLVDNSAPDRLGRLEAPLRARADRTLCIDHHPARETPWRHLILDERACATTVLVYELARACGWQPDRDSAEALYVGLATDTGFFRFNSTNARGHEVAAELLRAGVNPARAYGEIYERNSMAFTRLLGFALSEVRLESDGAIAVVEITRGRLSKLGAENVDTSEISTALLAIDGVRMALLFRELEDGRVKVSLRSKGGIDVHQLAGEFGGGGHRNASGIVMDRSLDETVRQVTERGLRLLG